MNNIINNGVRKMSLMEELEKKALYWEALESEIANDLNVLRDRISWDIKNLLFDDLETKLEYAESQWLNVNKLKEQFIDFRISSFKRDVERKIDSIKEKWNFFNTDTTEIYNEYRVLTRIENINKDELKEIIDNLDKEIKKWRLLLKVKDISESWGTSVYNIEDIQTEYLALKDKWIDVSEIEEILFDI
jgi:hypothetical protein